MPPAIRLVRALRRRAEFWAPQRAQRVEPSSASSEQSTQVPSAIRLVRALCAGSLR
jgi:hypothetical protein